MNDWMSASQAAAVLDISSRRVRDLIDAGVLPAQQLAGRWLVDTRAVRSRAAHRPLPGRPLSPALAWALLTVVQSSLDDDGRTDRGAGTTHRGSRDLIPDRQVRHRLRHLLAQPVTPRRWSSWLAARAGRRRVWTHPGIVDRLAADGRLHAGGAAAAAMFGLGSTRTAVRRFYLLADPSAPHDVDDVVRKYRLLDDPHGEVELMVVPGSALAAPALLSAPGPVPSAVALADLLESDDPRERHTANEALERWHLHERTLPWQ